MTTPKHIVFYHRSLAITAQVWLIPEVDPIDIILRQITALDLPREIAFKVREKYLHFPDLFYKHLETLHSIVDAIRKLGVFVLLRS